MAAWRLGRLWRRFFPKRYRLAVPVEQGGGPTVVLLHGIANDYHAWDYVRPLLTPGCRVLALDLLGFGSSPSPSDIDYTARDHADAVWRTLRRHKARRHLIVVGHSMGGLVAVELARRHPRAVEQLILVSMPIYRLDADRRLLPNQDSLYVRMYNYAIERQAFTLRFARAIQRLMARSMPGFRLEESHWYAFQKSLANTIINQSASDDLAKLAVPVTLLVGRLDAFIIGSHVNRLLKARPNIRIVRLNEPHDVGSSFAGYVAEEINAVVENRPVDHSHLRRRLLPRPAIKLPAVPKLPFRKDS